jgi:hypothetical protein
MFSVSQCNEGFTNTTSTPSAVPITSDNVADYIYKIYKADVKAIQNLADIAMKLQAGGVTVPGKMIIQNGLDVTNDTTLSGKLNVSGASALGGTLGVTGDTTLSGKLNVSGASALGGTLGVTGDTNIGGNLNVTGGTTLTSLQVNNGLQVRNGSIIDGLTKLSTLQVDSVNIGNNLNIGGNLNVIGGTTLTSLQVKNGSIIDGLTKLSTLQVDSVNVSGKINGNIGMHAFNFQFLPPNFKTRYSIIKNSKGETYSVNDWELSISSFVCGYWDERSPAYSPCTLTFYAQNGVYWILSDYFNIKPAKIKIRILAIPKKCIEYYEQVYDSIHDAVGNINV